MIKILKLEEYSLLCIVKNFNALLKSFTIQRFIKEKKLYPHLYDKIFNHLNSFYGGIPSTFLSIFVNDTYHLRDIRLCDKNFKFERDFEFLSKNNVRYLKLESLELIEFEKLYDIINCEEIIELAINDCQFKPEDLLCKKIKIEKNGLLVNKTVFSQEFPKLTNLTILNVQYTGMNDVQFYFLMKEVKNLTELNIMDTLIWDLKLLKTQKHLQHLQCGDLTSNAKENFAHLLCLDKLKTLRFNSPDEYESGERHFWNALHTMIKSHLTESEIDFYFKLPSNVPIRDYWNEDNVLSAANWKDLTFLEFTGSWIFSKITIQ